MMKPLQSLVGILFIRMLFISMLLIQPLQAEQVYTLKFATANPQGSHYVAHLMKFKQLVEHYSNGRIRVEAIIDGRYGSEHDNVMGTAEGDIQMSTVAVNNLTPFAPNVGFLTLPYLFDDAGQARRLFNHPLMDEVNGQMVERANVRALGWLIGGYRVLTNARVAVRSPADLADLKIRTPMNPIMVETFRAWGVEPLPIAWTETYNALRTGIADGQENPHLVYSNMPNADGGIILVQKYITDIRYLLWTGPHLINEPFYQGLPADLKEVLHKAADEASRYQWQWVEERNRQQLDLLLGNGMELVQPANEEREWRQRAKAVWPQFYSEIGGKPFIDRVLAIIRQ
ncbi:MAG: TRAP transporter substrate-binding protein [Motiliproteus sp.]